MNARTVQYLSIALFVSLLLWGGYTLFVYLGVPVHGAVLWTDAFQSRATELCGDTDFLCRGFYGFFPFILHVFGRAAPFLWYGILSIVLYAVFIGWQWFRAGELRTVQPLQVGPWKIFAAFLVLLWLLFTVLSYGGIGDRPTRYYFEPAPQIYNVGPQGLEALTNDFAALQQRGCLSLLGETQAGTGVYSLKGICMQASFVTRVLSQLFLVLVFLFELLVVGRAVLSLLRLRVRHLLLEAMLSIGLGIGAWIMLLWFLGVFSLFTATAGWALVVLLPILCFRHSRYWLHKFATTQWTYEWTWYGVGVLLFWFLLSYLALNFLTVIRPFPIGWDDLGSYLNRPRLMVSYGHFIPSMSTFQWEYLTSLGFLLFGYESTVGATSAMVINWTEGFLALLAVYCLANRFLGKGRGMLAAILYYTLPLVGHFSFADMKIDNAVFLMGTLTTLAIFEYLFGDSSDEREHPLLGRYRWLIIAGIFAGLLFSMKVTGIMVILSLVAVLFGARFHWLGLIGALFAALFVLLNMNVLNPAVIFERAFGSASGSGAFKWVVLLLSLGSIGAAVFLRPRRFVPALYATLLFGGVFIATMSPWLVHNNYLQGNVIPKLVLGAPSTDVNINLYGNTKDPNDPRPMRGLPPELVVDSNNPLCTPTGTKEELDRYWGFGGGLSHYLTLPWRTVMNLDSVGYYVTTTFALLLFPLLLVLPYFWTTGGRWLRYFFIATLFAIFQWIFAANGIPWYGVGMFLGLTVGLEALIARAPDRQNRVLMGILISMSILMSLSMRLWQFEQQRNILEYSFGKISARALEEITIPHYNDIRAIVLERREKMPDRPYLYRVGTFIPYFIPQSFEVIGRADHQLDLFNCMYQERDNKLTLRRLQALGFNSIVFDTNTHTIEADPNGSLHQKVNAFLNFANDPSLGLQIVINDPGAGVALILLP